mmetsp:Transcript_23863/g.53016  ORF Transcript_23863/g.53016 Transcript_23863/m.53016 type:complete len:216 (+) Transcript_23863:1108-1755(+)
MPTTRPRLDQNTTYLPDLDCSSARYAVTSPRSCARSTWSSSIKMSIGLRISPSSSSSVMSLLDSSLACRPSLSPVKAASAARRAASTSKMFLAMVSMGFSRFSTSRILDRCCVCASMKSSSFFCQSSYCAASLSLISSSRSLSISAISSSLSARLARTFSISPISSDLFRSSSNLPVARPPPSTLLPSTVSFSFFLPQEKGWSRLESPKGLTSFE